MAEKGPKPYVKLASTLVLVGMGLFTLERYGLSQFKVHLGGALLSAMVIVPLVLIVSGAAVFMVGRMRRL
jgi:hypothetical protein